MNRRRFAALLAGASLLRPAAATQQHPRTVDWDELLPPAERGSSAPPPVPVHDYLGEKGPPMVQTGSFAANRGLHDRHLRIPGFIVPLVPHQAPQVSEFFLVPYYGACIHVPPPPPNQIVHVSFARPRRIATIYDAYWVSGLVQVARKATRMATAVYAMAGSDLSVYR
jgi:hypothetical protein